MENVEDPGNPPFSTARPVRLFPLTQGGIDARICIRALVTLFL
jgi:hypothetical protein